jgi:Uma2 family endonuclease
VATAAVSERLNSVETLEDLLARLGNIPLSRVRFHPPPGTATERDLIAARHGPRPHLCELIDGVLVEKTVGTRESLLASLIVHFIWDYLELHDLGIALGADGAVRLWPGRIRVPDAAFVSWAQLPDGQLPDDPIAGIFPDLAVEVVSKNNTLAEIALKLDDFFRAGTRIAWVVFPKTRTAKVYSSPGEFKPVARNGKLVAGEVLPGFSLSLAKLFSRGTRTKRKSRD